MKILFSFVIFAFARSGCHGAALSRYGTLEVFFFLDSACEKSHVVVFFHTCNFASALDEHESGQRLSGKTYSSHFP